MTIAEIKHRIGEIKDLLADECLYNAHGKKDQLYSDFIKYIATSEIVSIGNAKHKAKMIVSAFEENEDETR